MSTILSSIGIQPLSLIGQIVSFLVLYVVFKKFLFGPILENLDKRAKKQAQALKAAEETVRIKEELETNEKKARQKLQREIQTELTKARTEAEQKSDEMISEAKAEAKRTAQKEYDLYQKKLEEKEKIIRQDISALVIQTTRKVLSEHLDQKTNQKIVTEQIRKLAKIKTQS